MKALLILASLSGHPQLPHSQIDQQLATMTCMSSGEEDSGAFHKICYYDCLGDRVAITIKSTALCPLTIQE